MYRAIQLTSALVVLISANAAPAQDLFNNKTAREARRTYEAAVKQAKTDYIEQLEVAKKEEGSKGDLKEANVISDEIEEVKREGVNIARSPIARNQRRLEGTRWGPSRNLTLRFLKNNRVVFSDGDPGTWTLVDPQTLVLHREKNSKVSVWKFDERLRSVEIHRFEKATGDRPEVYRKF